ncbi:MAG: hypothetical protein ACI8ZM_004303 [Crocinitomix sp.]|jgi:hypothetical protein
MKSKKGMLLSIDKSRAKSINLEKKVGLAVQEKNSVSVLNNTIFQLFFENWNIESID